MIIMAIKTIETKFNKQQKSTKNFKIINKIKPQLYFLIIILFSISILEAFPTKEKGERRKEFREKEERKQKDLICNVGDEHECVCNVSMGNLDSSNIPNCNEFIGGKSLDAVKIVVRDFNLTALLRTNETHEQYLRRRISQVLNRYCETVPDECPGTLAELRSQRLKLETSSRELDNLNDQTPLIIDDGGPSLTRENIVILRVIYLPGRVRTQISFVVLKIANTFGGINSSLTLPPKTIKYILSAQTAPLPRVLGGVKIEQIAIETLKKKRPPVNNMKLIIIIAVIAILMTICCTIAVAKVIYDISKTRCRQKTSKSNGTTTPSSENQKKKSSSSRNYGTCTDRLFASTSSNNNREDDGQLTSGQRSAESKSLRSSRRESNSLKRLWRKRGSSSGEKIKKISKTSESGNNKIKDDEENKMELDEEAISASSRSVTAYQNSFMCDHSQLPREDSRFDDEDFNDGCGGGDFEIIDMSRRRRQSSLLSNPNNKQRMEQKRHSLLLSPNNIRSPLSSDDDQQQRMTFRFSPKTKTPTTTPTRKTSNKRFSFSGNTGVTINTNIPSVVLLDEGTTNTVEHSSNVPKHTTMDIFRNKPNGGEFLLTASSDLHERPQSRLGQQQQHPFDRPLSRRGSRDDKHEEGEEETFNDTREDTPVPLGDDQQTIIVNPLAAVTPKNQLLDALKNKNKKKLLGKLLLLASETDSELDLGNEEEEEEEENEKIKKSSNNYLNKKENIKRESNATSSPESDEEEEGEGEEEENTILERHHYERLLESPMIQKTTKSFEEK
uniref:Uncharacterized protein n=1 Tax=Meloidogyne enterolobii TaxID=390850 RepID=A0A6V7TVW0_MELEN|nr:unnamed protein product [Meloidogyne enterolobii]